MKEKDSWNNCYFAGERFVLNKTHFILEIIENSIAFLFQGEEDGDSGMSSMITAQMALI